MGLEICKYKTDCVACRNQQGKPLCTILTNTSFKNGVCPFYKSRKTHYYDTYYEQWLEKSGDN